VSWRPATWLTGIKPLLVPWRTIGLGEKRGPRLTFWTGCDLTIPGKSKLKKVEKKNKETKERGFVSFASWICSQAQPENMFAVNLGLGLYDLFSTLMSMEYRRAGVSNFLHL
jgi:hypothetical protein